MASASAAAASAAAASAASSSASSDKNVLTVVRVRPVAAGTDVCFSAVPENPRQINLTDAKGKLALTYGLGAST